MKIILLARNFANYDAGNYHQDLVNAICRFGTTFIYGPGYKEYNKNDSLDDILHKAGWDLKDVNCIMAATSWDKYVQWQNGDPHPNIQLSEVENITKIYFLQNEYVKINTKLNYVEQQNFDYVISIYAKGLYDEWSERTGIKVIYSGHGIDLSKFTDHHLKRKYDFIFTGVLHEQFIPDRRNVKNELFWKTKLWRNREIHSNKGIYRLLSITNPIQKKYRKYKIYWAERHILARSLTGKNLVPCGEDYVKLLNESKVSLCTYSANRLIGPRFFELMRTGTLILCPKDDYGDLLIDDYNCIMYKKDMTDFYEKLSYAIENEEYRQKIVQTAKSYAENQDYDHKLSEIFDEIKENEKQRAKDI